MGSHGFTTDCPRCLGKDTVSASSETRSHYQSGECLRCGYHYWTGEGVMTTEELNNLRAEMFEEGYDFIPLTSEEREHLKKFDKEHIKK